MTHNQETSFDTSHRWRWNEQRLPICHCRLWGPGRCRVVRRLIYFFCSLSVVKIPFCRVAYVRTPVVADGPAAASRGTRHALSLPIHIGGSIVDRPTVPRLVVRSLIVRPFHDWRFRSWIFRTVP